MIKKGRLGGKNAFLADVWHFGRHVSFALQNLLTKCQLNICLATCLNGSYHCKAQHTSAWKVYIMPLETV